MFESPCRARLAAALVFCLSTYAAAAPAARQEAAAPPAPPAPSRFVVSAAASPIRVDGLLDEPAWSAATVIELDLEWFPGDNVEPPVRTRCLVTFDADNLYVAFQADDPDPTALRAHFSDRDSGFTDDTVGFLIDTFNDRRRAFQFRVNPLGVQMDSTLSDVDASEDWSWDAIWDARGRVREDGYDVEVRVPFSSLRFPRGAEATQTWGFLAMRDYPRANRHRMRSTWTDRDKSCIVCQFDTLTGFREITPGRNLELDPTITSFRTDERDPGDPDAALPDGPMDNGDPHAETGLTARWGITPNLTANAAINPDFSQVEADAAQLSGNVRFALFFPEKRPFFLEGADLFSTPMQAVFTRTVADPSAGLKISGKEGAGALGVFLARDARPAEGAINLIFPSNQRSDFGRIDERIATGVFRYRHDIGGTSTVGTLYTDREGGRYYNRTGGFDGTLRPTDSDVVRWQYLYSTTRYPTDLALASGQPEDSFRGDGYRINYEHQSRDWSWYTLVESLDPHFRADAGFIPRVDTRTAEAGIIRTFWPEQRSWYNNWWVSLGADRTEDHERHLSDEGIDFSIGVAATRQMNLEVGLSQNRDAFDGIAYNNTRGFLNFSLRPTGSFGAQVAFSAGETIDYDHSRRARFTSLSPGFDFNLGRRFRGSLSHSRQRLTVEGGDLFSEKITQTTLRYHLNLRTFFRLILQYTDLDLNTELFGTFLDPNGIVKTVPREAEHLLTQFLFSYKVNPQTVILFGYSDNRDGVDPTVIDPIDPADPEAVRLRRLDRTFFLKLGYAWVM